MGWQDRALCFGLSTDEIDELFFIGKGQKSTRAKTLCAMCPIQDTCLEFALIYEEVGIWAGTTDAERAKPAMRRMGKELKSQAIQQGTYHPRPTWDDLNNHRIVSQPTVFQPVLPEQFVPLPQSAIQEVWNRVDELLLELLA